MASVNSVTPSGPFGVALREIRLERGISLTALAKKVNYSKSHLSRVETGTKRATEWLVQRCDDTLEASGALVELARRSPGPRLSSTPAQKSPLPAQLPHVVDDFVGRDNVIKQLDELLLPTDDSHGLAPVVLLNGPAAAGKTTTAVHWANLARHRFPDGILFADLHGFTRRHAPEEPSRLLRRFLADLGDNGEHLGDDLDNLGALFRSRLTGRRVLVLLDNAADAEQIRPLLPAASGCAALLTSRNRMPGLVARDGVRRLTLAPMTSDESAALLARLLHTPLPVETMRRITDLACRLPLPIRVAAARWETLDTWEALANHDAMPLLTLLSVDHDSATSLRTLLDGSYQTLTPQTRQVFRLLGAGMHVLQRQIM